MIVNRTKFEYKNKILIEKVLISPPFRFKAIFQNEGCFIYIKGSPAQVISDNERVGIENKEAVLLQCGNYFVDWLKEIKNEKVEVIAVHLYPDILRELFDKELPESLVSRKESSKIKSIIPEETFSKFLESLDFYFQNPAVVNDDLLELKIKELILLLIQTEKATSVQELFTSIFSPRILNIKKTVKQHLYSNISVKEMASLCNLSLSSFKREFKNTFNSSPVVYLNEQRIIKAKEFLQASELLISEISYSIGYNDPQYFARIFKKLEKVSPTEYRKMNKK